MKKLSCMIIDDDEAFIALLQASLLKSDMVEIVGVYEDPEKGFLEIANQRPQIVFLDVEMPGMNGTDIVKNLNYKPQIILMSSSNTYGIDAYDLGVTDYLLKPIESYARLVRSLEKAKENLSKQPINDDFLFVKVDSSFVNIKKSDIEFIQAYGDYVKMITGSRTLVIKSKIGDMDEKLIGSFLRVHRSYIVNLTKIMNIEQNSIQIGTTIIPISDSYRNTMMERIKTL